MSVHRVADWSPVFNQSLLFHSQWGYASFLQHLAHFLIVAKQLRRPHLKLVRFSFLLLSHFSFFFFPLFVPVVYVEKYLPSRGREVTGLWECGMLLVPLPCAVGCPWCDLLTLLASLPFPFPPLPQDTLHGSLWWDVGEQTAPLWLLCKKKPKTPTQNEAEHTHKRSAIAFPSFRSSPSHLLSFFFVFFFSLPIIKVMKTVILFLSYWCSVHPWQHRAVFCSWTTKDGSSWSHSCWAWGSAWLSLLIFVFPLSLIFFL